MAETGIGISFGSTGPSPVLPPQHQSNTSYTPLENLPKPIFSSPGASTSNIHGQLLSDTPLTGVEDERELQAHIEKQTHAIKLQHDAFNAERECWNMERNRLNRRIASLEGLLKSSNTHSPAGSPPFAPYQQGFVPLPSTNPRTTTSLASTRLPSIAEDGGVTGPDRPRSPPKRKTSIRRDSAPSRIDLSHTQPRFDLDGQADSNSARLDPAPTVEASNEPSTPRDYTLSPPPAAYTEHAGHTPLKMPDKPMLDMSPTGSHRSTLSIDHVTESNTQFNQTDIAQNGQDESDPALKGPLKLPGLPSDAGPNNFTMEMLTLRLKEISDNPGANAPSALCAPGNGHDKTSMSNNDCTRSYDSDSPSAAPALPPPANTSPHVDGERSPRPTPVNGHVNIDDVVEDELHHRGIKLKKKPSCNFGAPLGQLGPKDQTYKKF